MRPIVKEIVFCVLIALGAVWLGYTCYVQCASEAGCYTGGGF